MLAPFIFVERCRICREYVNYSRSGVATLCAACWSGLSGDTAVLDHCAVTSETVPHIVVASGVKYEGAIKELVYKLKYDNDILLAGDLCYFLERAWSILTPSITEEPVLVPVPLHWWRLMKRGYNQSELLSRHLAKRANVAVAPQWLMRTRWTKAHHDLGRAERWQNIQGAFRTKPISVAGRSIVLVDDIYTSGATLAEAARTLLQHGCREVVAVTVARAALTEVEAEVGTPSVRS